MSLTACALKTSRIKLGTGVTMPHTRHPSVTASAFATLNEIARGRLRIGISIGDNGLRTVGRSMATIKELEAYVAVLKSLLSNRAVKFDNGVEGKLTWLERPTDIPIYIAATGPRLTRAAGRIGDGVILLRGLSPDQMGAGVDTVRQEAKRAGRPAGEPDIICWIQSSLGHDRELARTHAQGLVAEVLQMCAIEMFDEEDRPAIRRIKKDYDFYKQTMAYGEGRALVPDKFIDMFSLAGTAPEARERIAELMQVEGLNEIIICPQHLEGSPGPSVEQTIRSFAEGVMANLV